MKRYAAFLGQFIKNPSCVGAVAPSSPALARAITKWARLKEATSVVEYGAGDGAITPFILEKLGEQTDFFAMELSDIMCEAFRERVPDVDIYCDSVENVGKYLAERGKEGTDVIISGLPWTTFSASLQDKLLKVTLDSLVPGGQFATYGYVQGLTLPSAWRFRKRLMEGFSHVSMSPIVWKNIPPAVVYQCVK